MKKRRIRNWDNDNYIMSKFGKSIREKIKTTLIKSQCSIIEHRPSILEEYVHELIPKDESELG